MSEPFPPLEAEIRRRIAAAGAMPVMQYMTLCLTHPTYGYYVTVDPFGAAGDFTTAPEISQMFGELIGLWAGSVWRQMGSPTPINLIELGPGRGSMMQDALRAANVMPEFRSAIVLHMVEVSPILEKRQREFLGGSVPTHWYQALEEVPEGPSIILANEFFDALPVHQAVMCADGWHERVVKIDENDKLRFGIARDPIPLFEQLLPRGMRSQIGEIFEWRADQIALELGRRVKHGEGAALVIDYGHIKSAPGDTLQAVGKHQYADPLLALGQVDLTAHVDFQALGDAAESMGARAFGPLDQGEFLHRLGIETRANALKSTAPPSKVIEIEQALQRLTGTTGRNMGHLFKAMGFAHPRLGPLPGFDP
ncbi:MAG TPA: SAM-dependent methyltransferase [Xanthobacteraceae bacterium]|jgi:SAM-dependent MidA family methyltransferase|nr:SAM-dependent methyltransferase [Xanthobacteraceae bacterium]